MVHSSKEKQYAATKANQKLIVPKLKRTPRYTRRRFVRRTAAALGAAFAGPAIVPASVFGRNGALPPSERITMGFIGVGGQGGGHLLGGAWTYVAGGYAGRKDVQVLAVCDIRRARREEACKKVNDHYAETYGKAGYKSCEPYNDFREVLDRDDIDAVLIATPVHWHATMAAMAAEAGKDIYCEKPSAVTIQESQGMLAAVRRYGRVYQAGTQQRSEYGGKFRQACEFVRSGRIGTLREIYAYRDGGGIAWPSTFGPGKQVPPGLDWDLYLGPAPWIPYDGNADAHRFCTGELNWGQHHYDIVQWAAGADDTGPVEIFVEEGRSCYKYASGVVVYGKPYPGEAIGGEGGACFVGSHGRIAVDRSALVSDPPELVREPLRPNELHLYRSESHSGNFLECVRTRKQAICDASIAHRAASALLLGGLAKQLNRRLRWDPKAERFIEDEEANRMLSIAKRPPWCV
jgi:predicted dehydrogenase